MDILSHKRCIIGEGPIGNPFNEKLYYVNAFANEVCTFVADVGTSGRMPYLFR